MANDKINKSVSTRAGRFINPNQPVPCALHITYYDDMVRIEFAPELPESKRSETRRYDYENSVMTALTRSKCNELYNAYVNVIRPALRENKDTTISIPLASVNLLIIGTGIDSEGTPHPFIELCRELNPDTLMTTPDKRIRYTFNIGEYILGYNPETGTYTKRVFTMNEIELFFNDIKNIRDASSNAFVHTDRVVNKYAKDQLDSKVNRIGEKLGLDLASKPQFQRGNGGRGSIFDQHNQTHNNTEPTTATSIDDIEALMREQLGEGDLPF